MMVAQESFVAGPMIVVVTVAATRGTTYGLQSLA
jgi:hypothetical protein